MCSVGEMLVKTLAGWSVLGGVSREVQFHKHIWLVSWCKGNPKESVRT